MCSAISGRKLRTGSGGCLKSNVIDGINYKQRTTIHNNTAVGTNGLHGANVHLAVSPSINRSLHKQPIELISEILSPPLFPFYHRPCSCNKLHSSKPGFLGHFLLKNPPAYQCSIGRSSLGSAKQLSKAEKMDFSSTNWSFEER